jgi:hypothetical protein
MPVGGSYIRMLNNSRSITVDIPFVLDTCNDNGANPSAIQPAIYCKSNINIPTVIKWSYTVQDTNKGCCGDLGLTYNLQTEKCCEGENSDQSKNLYAVCSKDGCCSDLCCCGQPRCSCKDNQCVFN